MYIKKTTMRNYFTKYFLIREATRFIREAIASPGLKRDHTF